MKVTKKMLLIVIYYSLIALLFLIQVLVFDIKFITRIPSKK